MPTKKTLINHQHSKETITNNIPSDKLHNNSRLNFFTEVTKKATLFFRKLPLDLRSTPSPLLVEIGYGYGLLMYNFTKFIGTDPVRDGALMGSVVSLLNFAKNNLHFWLIVFRIRKKQRVVVDGRRTLQPLEISLLIKLYRKRSMGALISLGDPLDTTLPYNKGILSQHRQKTSKMTV